MLQNAVQNVEHRVWRSIEEMTSRVHSPENANVKSNTSFNDEGKAFRVEARALRKKVTILRLTKASN